MLPFWLQVGNSNIAAFVWKNIIEAAAHSLAVMNSRRDDAEWNRLNCAIAKVAWGAAESILMRRRTCDQQITRSVCRYMYVPQQR